MGFVGNYAPCGLSPQTDGMPVIPKNPAGRFRRDPFICRSVLTDFLQSAYALFTALKISLTINGTRARAITTAHSVTFRFITPKIP